MAIDLGYKMYIDVFDKYPLLDKKKERKLLLLAKLGDKEAFDTLILSNVRLAVDVTNRFSNPNILDEELIQEGIYGLIKAFEKFDVSYENRFSTYATRWVEHYIRRAIDKHASAIRTPINLKRKLIDLRKKLDDSKNIEYGHLEKEYGISKNVLKALILSLEAPISMDISVGDDGERSLYDYVVVEDTYEEITDKIALDQMITKAELTKQELTVIRGLFFDEKPGEAFANELGMSRPWVYVIRNKALDKLRKYK